MANRYFAGFDVSALTLGTITLSTAGKSDAVVTLSSVTDTAGDSTTTSLFCHPLAFASQTSQGSAGSSVLQEWSAVSYAAALQTDLRAAATAQSWVSPSNINVTCSASTGIYTIAYSTATFSIAWSTAAGRNFLGYSGNQSGGTSYVGDQTPTYIIAPTLTDVSDPTTNYEPGSIASHAMADDGTGFGIARTESPIYRDWIQQFETKAKTLRLSAASAHPWTFQHLFEHCRTVYPFYVTSSFNAGSNYEAFKLREDGCSFKPERATPGNDTQFHVPFRCHVLGTEGA